MNKRQYQTAKDFNIIGRIEKLESELLKVEGVKKIEFDLCGFYDDIHQVIFVAGYELENDYNFDTRKKLINDILKVCNDNGLVRTEDSIEDYGASYYFVTRCSKDWIE